MAALYASRSGRKSRNGIALMTVLISLTVLVMLFALVSQALLGPQLTFRRLTSNTVSLANTEGLLAAIRPLIAAKMLEPEQHGALDGRPQSILYDGQTYMVSAQDLGGLIDLNTSSSALIEALFLRSDPTQGAASADAFLAARSAEPFSTLDGALDAFAPSTELAPQMRALITLRTRRRHLNPTTVPPDLAAFLAYSSRTELIADLGPTAFRPVSVETVRISAWRPRPSSR